MSDEPISWRLKYRFRCLKCQTTVEKFVPFKRVLCPLCKGWMNPIGQRYERILKQKGGEKP
jgi:Zn finger protein HypA/HybF involved in hydrogenase expression